MWKQPSLHMSFQDKHIPNLGNQHVRWNYYLNNLTKPRYLFQCQRQVIGSSISSQLTKFPSISVPQRSKLVWEDRPLHWNSVISTEDKFWNYFNSSQPALSNNRCVWEGSLGQESFSLGTLHVATLFQRLREISKMNGL